MPVRVAVVDPLPMFARGLAATLCADGYLTDTPDDVVDWARRTVSAVVILTVSTQRDWVLVGDISRVRPEAVVVVVLDTLEPDGSVRAIESGAVVPCPGIHRPPRYGTP